MSQYVEKLLSIAGTPIGPRIDAKADFGGAPYHDLVRSLLRYANGFYAFESALHVFPLSAYLGNQGIDSWNAPDLWKDHYCGMADEVVFFAEDSFGGQFGMKGEAVYTLDPETGDSSLFAGSIGEWAQKILENYEFHTGYPLAHEWQLANGPLAMGERLIPKRPFVLGGQYDLANLASLDAVKGMRFRGDLAVQIRDLPDGASIVFDIVD
jgi:hypothetical protein